VSCRARDAQARQSSCSFDVTLNGFTLAAKKFDAFGDSLTAGENGLPSIVDPPNAYPTKLQALFDAYYPGQGLTVVNRGEPGQRIERTLALLGSSLNSDRPDAVLLLGGYNNLTLPCSPGLAASPGCRDAIDFVAFGFRDCIRKAKESPIGVKYIFVSTLTPPGPTGAKRIDREAVIEVNRRIRLMIASERVTLVDSYPVFTGHEAEYVSPDGLHLLPPGYQALADTFFSAIQATVTQTAQLTAELR
jgi:lysophospholipase L1-like esterase